MAKIIVDGTKYSIEIMDGKEGKVEYVTLFIRDFLGDTSPCEGRWCWLRDTYHRVYPPSWWEKLVGITWEDKVDKTLTHLVEALGRWERWAQDDLTQHPKSKDIIEKLEVKYFKLL